MRFVVESALQKHAGLHFTLSIVELALFKLPGGGYVAQPRILARTTNIERAIITLQDARMVVTSPSGSTSRAMTRATTISQEHFLEEIERNCPGISKELTAFLDEIAIMNVVPDFGAKTLTLRWHLEDAQSWNLGSIVNSGEVWMDYHGQQARNLNFLDQSKQYLEHMANLVPGASVKMTKSKTAWNLADANGHSLRIDALLQDDSRREGWSRAIALFQGAVAKLSEI